MSWFLHFVPSFLSMNWKSHGIWPKYLNTGIHLGNLKYIPVSQLPLGSATLLHHLETKPAEISLSLLFSFPLSP